ncbi:MAG: 1-acyl-sn-glycerol-3-phosphate acyltransferase [Tannerella sp.]|jgi:1-acyl-sn-glycerol-3-phosphate acyltransferase|nr:1-acyl-sn-glycerol-3-phosphate acyltransferase [Tannerella sp.]
MAKALLYKQHILYRVFRTYIRPIHDRLYYRHTYRLQTENIPSAGTPLLIVSNHQNCLNDPLGILFALNDRKPAFITRADIFMYHPIFNKFLYGIGLLPAFRMEFEGEEALGRNKKIFIQAEHELAKGQTVVMFPESGHQDKHWLGNFSFGYTKLAFEAAELTDFKTDIFILPSCNHYSDYFHIQEDSLVKFGTPVSLRPYYELYKTKPRTAQRQVNALVREQIENMMLDIRDLENYQAIDFLRNTYGVNYARQYGYDAKKLPDRLLSDRAFVAALEQAQTNHPETVRKIYADALTLEDGIRRMKINDRLFDKPLSLGQLALRGALLLVLLPAWLIALCPNALNYLIPAWIMRRIHDRMFYGSFTIAINVLITIPLFYTIAFILMWIYANIWMAFIYFVSLPALGLFAWYYRKFFLSTRQAWNYHKQKGTTTLDKLKALRTALHQRLTTVFMTEKKI